MQLGMVGLGRMGGNMTERLSKAGHDMKTFDRSSDSTASSLEELVSQLDPPRSVWLMIPAAAVDAAVAELAPHLERGDTIIDGGNSYYVDDLRRAKELAERGIHFVDCGTSGGVWGLERGYCLMVGGDRAAFQRLEPIFRTLAPGKAAAPPTPGRSGAGSAEEGYLHCGPTGAGHFVKMIHNGIEYGLMQAYAEGFDILHGAGSPEVPEELRYPLELSEIAELWRRGSVVSSWLLDLAAAALSADPQLSAFRGAVADSGEGRWTVQAAVEEAVPAPVLSASLFARFRSREESTLGDKLLSAMRREFGGHAEATRREEKP